MLELDHEKIDVAHIRIEQANLQVAVLGAFREADRLLTAWVNCASDYFEFDYEVTFLDGYVYKGRYEFWRKSKRLPSLSRHVRQVFAGDLSRYAIDGV